MTHAKSTIPPVVPELAPAGRGSWSALLISATLHCAVFAILSLIVLTTVADTKPVLTVFIDEPESEVDRAAFVDVPDIDLVPPPVSSSTPEMNIIDVALAENQPDISKSSLPDITNPAATSVRTTGGNGVDQQAVSMIQGRVAKAGGNQGEVQFALAWRDRNDVDLHVIAPSGERICYGHKHSVCDGELDVDMNVQGDNDEPVENVRWLSRRAPIGRYTVLINLYQVHSRNFRRAGTPYQLLAKLGEESELVEDSVRGGRSIVVHRFHYVPKSYSGRRRELALERLIRQQAVEDKQALSLLDRAVGLGAGVARDRRLQDIVFRYPHTDAAIEALSLMSGTSSKL